MRSRHGSVQGWRGEVPLSPTEKEERELKNRLRPMNTSRQLAATSIAQWSWPFNTDVEPKQP